LSNSKSKDENRYTSRLDNLLPLDEQHREHYTNIYKIRNNEVKDYFMRFGIDRIVVVDLEDSEKWQKIGSFFKIAVEPDYEVHSNKSNI
jgi:hypothetical protein